MFQYLHYKIFRRTRERNNGIKDVFQEIMNGNFPKPEERNRFRHIES